MIELNCNELQQIQLNILQEVNEICEQQNIRYSLTGGTLIGAIRHKGYIPWDDDIDIIMPRPDYILFENYCRENETGFELITNNTNKNYWNLFGKACDRNTILEENHCNRAGARLGVSIDIFPVDGLGNSYYEAKREFFKTALQREVLTAANWDSFFKSHTKPWYIEPIRFFFYTISRIVDPDKIIASINKRCNKKNFDDCLFCGCISGSYRLREIMERDCFDGYIDVLFEGRKYKAVRNYDKYLTHIYGDYMKFPPVEKQVSNHEFQAYYKNGKNE